MRRSVPILSLNSNEINFSNTNHFSNTNNRKKRNNFLMSNKRQNLISGFMPMPYGNDNQERKENQNEANDEQQTIDSHKVFRSNPYNVNSSEGDFLI